MKGRILIIDDEEGMLSALKTAVTRSGYHVDTADTVDEGMTRLKDEAYDVVLADKNIPGLDGAPEGGMEIVRYVGSSLSDTLVIMMTGNATVESARDAMKMGAFDYVLKPFRAKEMLDKIERAMDVMSFIQPVRMMDLHKALREQVLAVIESGPAKMDDVDAMMEPVNRVLDGIVLLQKEKERMMIRQREALAEIASFTAQVKDWKGNLPSDLASLLDRIAGAARIRM